MIGSLGPDIIFSVSDSKVLTFSGFQRTVSGQWSKHTRIGAKSRQEFCGPELQSASMDITLDAMLGVKPRATLDAIAKMVEDGTAEPLVIGNAQVGKNPFVITQVSESWDVIMGGGELMRATLSLSLEEYV